MPTEVFQIGKVFIKAEALQLGGSHKARAAKAVIQAAEDEGKIRPGQGDTILEKSGGNFGIGLALHGIPRGHRIQLLVRPKFSALRRRMLSNFGVELIGGAEMEAGWTNSEILAAQEARAKAEGKRVYFTDQFSNPKCIEGHRVGAEELASQLLERGVSQAAEITFVSGVGTGASLMAYASVLREHFPSLKVVCAEPMGCSVRENRFMDHPFQGVGVGVIPPLLDLSIIGDSETASLEEAEEAGRELVARAGLFLGMSSWLAYAVAKKRVEAGDPVVVMIGYDGGEVYFADAQAGPQRVKRVLDAMEWARGALPPSETIGLSITDYEAIFTQAQSYIDEDLNAYILRDPAAGEAAVVEAAYLSFKAVAIYRIAHALYHYQDGDSEANTGRRHPAKIVARRLSEMIKSETGVEIHPGAQIGHRFVVDHGAGTVVGETAMIGDDCYILNNVTLGSLGVADNSREGRRHPKLGDRVQIGGNTNILGPITIGDDVFIGAHRLVTHDVPSGTRMTVLQELIMERTVGRPTGPKPEIHAILPKVRRNCLQVVGINLEGAIGDFVVANDGERAHPTVRILRQKSNARYAMLEVDFQGDADLSAVALRMRSHGTCLTTQNSLPLRRALEALRGGGNDS